MLKYQGNHWKNREEKVKLRKRVLKLLRWHNNKELWITRSYPLDLAVRSCLTVDQVRSRVRSGLTLDQTRVFNPRPGTRCFSKIIKLTFLEHQLIARPHAKLFACISFNPQNKPIRLVFLLIQNDQQNSVSSLWYRIRTGEKSVSRMCSRFLSWEVDTLGFRHSQTYSRAFALNP